jgi:hypothetical protein
MRNDFVGEHLLGDDLYAGRAITDDRKARSHGRSGRRDRSEDQKKKRKPGAQAELRFELSEIA